MQMHANHKGQGARGEVMVIAGCFDAVGRQNEAKLLLLHVSSTASLEGRLRKVVWAPSVATHASLGGLKG